MLSGHVCKCLKTGVEEVIPGGESKKLVVLRQIKVRRSEEFGKAVVN